MFGKSKDDSLEDGGKFYGIYKGFVHKNDDPDKLARLKLKVPQVYGEQVFDYWALPKGMYAGNKYGEFNVPEEGDPVWVQFEGGDVRFPVWEYGWFLKDKNIEEIKESYPKNKVFKTPAGNMVEYDDKNKLIRLTSAKGKVIELSDKISLGTKGGSNEKAALGDTLKQKLDDICTQIENLCAACEALVVVTPSGNSTAVVNVAQFTAVHTQISTIKGTLGQILSQITTLD